MVPTAEHVDLFKSVRDHPEVVRAVLEYDPKALIWYDKASCRWKLARCTERGFINQFTWEYELADGTKIYRRLDMELVKLMMRWDRWRNFKNADQEALHAKDQQEGAEQKTWKDFDDDIDYLSRWNRAQNQQLKTLLTI